MKGERAKERERERENVQIRQKKERMRMSKRGKRLFRGRKAFITCCRS
jgi:hypothetical protein